MNNSANYMKILRQVRLLMLLIKIYFRGISDSIINACCDFLLEVLANHKEVWELALIPHIITTL